SEPLLIHHIPLPLGGGTRPPAAAVAALQAGLGTAAPTPPPFSRFQNLLSTPRQNLRCASGRLELTLGQTLIARLISPSGCAQQKINLEMENRYDALRD